MSLRIQNNIAALNTHRNLQLAGSNLSKSLERLSSGFRINKASDDAAGLAVSMRFRSQIGSLKQGARNASEATSMLQIAEGAADQITNILQRMKELATQAASSNTSQADRVNIDNEVTSLRSEIDRIATSTKYSGTRLIDGSFGTLGVSTWGGLNNPSLGIVDIDVSGAAAGTTYTVTISSVGGAGTATNTLTITQNGSSQTIERGALSGLDTNVLNFSTFGIKVTVNNLFATANTTTTMSTTAAATASFQVGYEDASDNRISFSIGDLTENGLSLTGIDVSSITGAQTALTTIDDAINDLADVRASIGGAQNRLEFARANLSTMIENMSAAESVIRDADMAQETVDFTKNRILTQAGIAMLAQANMAPEGVLSLLR
ncbi:MAG: flagellin N-terminal helical domain-containing protein [Candidatus Loosdrechtia sp.]|uniref:flagellin N-terminal helical domain-containing protein n=1 Tax=Candidatus Loosdrechtia sp. TaxID=3101272 RepID=UPI003A74F3C0|nr:MAG: flagellin [Candidatus Jettenia sp. AMX2]